MAIELHGPTRRIFPNGEGERWKFKFKNCLEEPIYDMWIRTNGPDLIAGTIKIRCDGKEIEIEDGLEPGDESENVHVTFIDEIKEDKTFTITIDFDEDFDEDEEWIRFSPTDEDDATIKIEAKTEESLSYSHSSSRKASGVVRGSKEEQAIVSRWLREMGSKKALAAIEEANALHKLKASPNSIARMLSDSDPSEEGGCC